jgi:L-asparaginase/Glu-tRNA(Gln) amidotransferase subunit D
VSAWIVRGWLVLAAVVATLGVGRAQDMAKPRVLVLTTGGTIASRVGASMQDGNTLVSAVPQLAEHATVTV